MNIQTMSCPSCGGAIAVTDQCEVECDYCGKHLNVDRGDAMPH